MILIADSGSTKTTWAVLNGGSKMITTIGLNPRVTVQEQFVAVLCSVRQQLSGVMPEVVHFFGAGCGTGEAQRQVGEYIHQVFPQANVTVESDLMGACIALCGQKGGYVGILGTGSNACQYDGRNIVKRMVSLGYILGDEGSGNHLGRMLLKRYFNGSLPQILSDELQTTYVLTVEDVLRQLYQEQGGNRYLASFVPFIRDHRDHPYIHQLLLDSFNSYFEEQVVPLGGDILHLVGSVAAVFREELVEAAQPYGVTIGTVMKEPIEGLIKNLN